MNKRYAASVQKEPNESILLFKSEISPRVAVFGVANDGAVDVGKVPSELMTTTRLGIKLHPSIAGFRVALCRDGVLDSSSSAIECFRLLGGVAFRFRPSVEHLS